MQDADGKEIVVGSLVKHIDPKAAYGLHSVPRRVKAVQGRVAILDFDPTTYDPNRTKKNGQKVVIETGSNAYAGFNLRVVE